MAMSEDDGGCIPKICFFWHSSCRNMVPEMTTELTSKILDIQRALQLFHLDVSRISSCLSQ